MTRFSILGLCMFLAVTAALAQVQVGSKTPDFALTDVQGQSVPFGSLKGDVTVVAFIATKCPISNDYNARMSSLYNDYAGRGVKFVFVNSNVSEPAEEVAEHTRQNKFPFAVYKDNNSAVADQFGAQVTPEVFVLDKAGVLRYHGHIDDSRNPAKIQANTLRTALDAMLAGRAVGTSQTKAFGCTIKRGKKAS